MRLRADDHVLRIAREAHDASDVRRRGEREQVRQRRQPRLDDDCNNERREHDAHGVVDEECRQRARGSEGRHDDELCGNARQIGGAFAIADRVDRAAIGGSGQHEDGQERHRDPDEQGIGNAE